VRKGRGAGGRRKGLVREKPPTRAKPPLPAVLPSARAEISIENGIPRAQEPFPPRGFFGALRADLEEFWKRVELLLKAGEPPKRLPPENLIEE